MKYIDIVKFLGIFLLFIEHTGNWTELGGKYNYLKIWIELLDIFFSYAFIFYNIWDGCVSKVLKWI